MLLHLRDRTRRLLGRLFRDDVFISYTRADGLTHALALANELVKQEYATFVDLYDTEASETIPLRVMERLRVARLLVVVATPGAAQSTAMELELMEFRRTGRNVVVIDVADGVASLPWRDRLRHLPRLVHETQAGVMVAAIADAFQYLTRAQWLRRYIWLSIAIVAALAAGAVVLTQRIREAGELRIAAESAKTSAESAASAARLASEAGRAFARRDTRPGNILLALAESLKRNPNAEADGVAEAVLRLHRTPRRSAATLPEAETLLVSDDGNTIAALGAKRIDLFDRATLRRRRIESIPGLGDRFKRVSLAPDGASMVITRDASGLEEMFLVDLRAQPPVARRDGVLGGLSGIAFSRRGDVYFAADFLADPPNITAYRVADGRALWSVADPEHWAVGEGVLAVVIGANRVELRDEKSGRLLGAPIVTDDPFVARMLFSGDGKRLLILAGDTGMRASFEVHAVPSGGISYLLARRPVAALDWEAAISRDGAYFVLRTGQTIGIWKGDGYARAGEVTAPSVDFAFLPDARHLLVWNGSAMRLFDLEPQAPTPPEAAWFIVPEMIAYTTAGSDVITLRKQGGERSLEIHPGVSRAAIVVPPGTILDSTGKYAVSPVSGGGFQIIDAATGRVTFARALGNAGGLTTSAGASVVGVAAMDHTTGFDRRTNRVLPDRERRFDEGPGLTSAMSPNGEWLAVVSHSFRNTVRISTGSTRTGRIVDSFVCKLPVKSLAISNDGRIVAFAGEDGRLCARNTRTKTDKCSRVPIASGQIALSPDDRLIAAGGEDGVVQILNVWTSTPQTVDAGGLVQRVLFDRRGRTLAAIVQRAGASEIVLIDVASATIRRRISAVYPIGAAAFATDRDLVVIEPVGIPDWSGIVPNGIVRTIAVDPPLTVAEICAGLEKVVQEDEWLRLLQRSERFSNPCAR